MSIQYTHARKGYIFKPTAKGLRDGKIASKYKETYPNEQYKTCVPKRWVSDGFVVEVRNEN